MESRPATTPDAGPAEAASGDGRRERLLAWAAMAVAVAVRVLFLADKPFWRDEAWVALIAADPLRAAADGRAAPLGFLLATKAAAALPWLPPEVSYRLLPLLGGLALLPLLARFARVVGASRRTAVAVMWIAAGVQPLVYYSRELKSYGLDALLAVLAPLAGLVAFGGAGGSAAARLVFAAVVVVAPWISFGGIFAVGAVLAWGWLAWWRSAGRAQRIAWLLCSAAFLASFAAVYALALGHQADDPWMHHYWNGVLRKDDTLALPLRFLSAMVQVVEVSTGYLFPEGRPVAIALAIVGLWSWPRGHRGFLLFQYVATAAICAAAAVTDRYLLVSGRLLLVAAPLPLLWVAGGLDAVGRRLGARAGGVLVAALPVAFALLWSVQAVEHRVGPYRTDGNLFFRYDVLHDVDDMIAIAEPLVRPGQSVLVSRRCTYAFRFYREGRLPGATVCEREDAACDRLGTRWMKRLKGKGWILMTDEDGSAYAKRFERLGFARRIRASARGVMLWEVEKSGRPATPRKGRP